MLFNSLAFLFFFLPVTYFVFWSLKGSSSRYVWLTITGYVFYSFWNYKFCALMAFSTLISYFAGRGLLRWSDPGRRRLCLVVPIVIDLSMLAFFKYANFAIASLASVSNWIGISFHPSPMSIVLPIGISFYTFHTITYIVDAYRGVIKPTRNLFEFSSYVSMFSQLVAGPIVRFRQIEGDLESIDKADRRANLNAGWSFFVIGMVKKVVIADTIARMINPVLNSSNHFSTVTAWLLMLGYSCQLYFDFSGYSDMAVGLGRLFGLRLPQNFNSPYKALDMVDFWRRWHISLSTCLRDYLYIPLGGNHGPKWRATLNLLLTMLLGGLWHGANWTFVTWGAYHGMLLVLQHLIAPMWAKLWIPFRRLVTMILVVVGWVIFRSDTMGMALSLLHSMFFWTGGDTLPWAMSLAGVVALAWLIASFGKNTFELRHEWNAGMSLVLAGMFSACIFIIYAGDWTPFLYFQF